MIRRICVLFLFPALGVLLACSQEQTTGDRLREWRQGVWMLTDGSYAIYTENHYFVISASGDSSRANIYCGASQIRFTDKGMARKQTLRVRKFPGGDLAMSKDSPPANDQDYAPLEIDMALFQPGSCNIADGVIYDSVTEETDDFILLATCNGDEEKIFSDGRSAYLPAGGGEYWARRIEAW